jgi:hypothetical protein
MGRGGNSNFLYGDISKNSSSEEDFNPNSVSDSGLFNDYSQLIEDILTELNYSPTSVSLNQDVIDYQRIKFNEGYNLFEGIIEKKMIFDDKEEIWRIQTLFSGSETWRVLKYRLPKWINNNQSQPKIEPELGCFLDYNQVKNADIISSCPIVPLFDNKHSSSKYDFNLRAKWANKSPVDFKINLLDLLAAEKAVARPGQWIYSEGDQQGEGNHYLLYISNTIVQAIIKPDDPINSASLSNKNYSLMNSKANKYSNYNNYTDYSNYVYNSDLDNLNRWK